MAAQAADDAAASRRQARRTPKRPASSLAERWSTIDGVDVFYRESSEIPDAPAMVHLHGFGLSGRYLLPTAERLADEFHTLVPDLPGFGLSWRAPRALDVPGLARTAATFLDDRGVGSATLVGNSMGCSVICEFAYEFPERVERAVLVVIEGAAHAINFSHPDELANVIRLFMAGRPIVDDPDSPGFARAIDLHRGSEMS